MDLFDFNNNEEGAKPLAEKMRALKEIATALNISPEQAEQIFREIWRKKS